MEKFTCTEETCYVPLLGHVVSSMLLDDLRQNSNSITIVCELHVQYVSVLEFQNCLA